jgi:hypothetical protein
VDIIDINKSTENKRCDTAKLADPEAEAKYISP